MKLISMTDFVINKRKELLRHSEYKNDLENYANIIYNYANFLKQPLTLEMFVPCDEDGNVLENPFLEKGRPANGVWEKYKQAKEKVLFEEFEIDKNLYLVYRNEIAIGKFISYENESKFLFREYFKTIEDLHDFEFPFTENAIKQIGL